MKKQSKVCLVLMVGIVLLTFVTTSGTASSVHRPPGATNTPEPTQEPTPEPTCVPPSPDYPEPCHEHDRGIFTDQVFLPVVIKH